MGKTLRSYLLRELLAGAFAGLGLFTFILFIGRLLELVDLVVARGVPAAAVARLFAYILPSFLEIAIPVSVLLGVVVAFGRLSSDGEMLALRAAGVSLWQMLAPVAALGCAAAVVTVFVAGWARPWSLQRVDQTLYDIARTRATAALRPAMFNSIGDGVILYAERIDPNARRLDRILLSDERGGDQRTTVMARRAELSGDEAARELSLRLEDGTSVTSRRDTENYDTTVFSSLEIHLNLATAFGDSSANPRAPELRYASELRAERASLREQGKSDLEPALELHRRGAFALGALMLAIIGVPLGLQPSKSVRARGFAVSIAVALAYYVTMTTARSLARNGTIGPAAAMWAPDALFALTAVWMVSRTAADRAPYPIPRLRRSFGQVAGKRR